MKTAEYKNLIEKMTLEEKAALLSGEDFWQTKEIKRLGIPSLFLADGPHGLRKQQAASDHLGLNPGIPATCFPTAAAVANSWDIKLAERIGECIADEAVASGVSVVLGPGLNIKRNPLCGRNFEYFSEDPYVSGKLAAAYIKGIQSRGIGACPKHFAANNQEFLRLTNDSVMDERTLREIYLTGFEIAVKEGKPKTLMSSYNLLNGTYTNENEFLLNQILREEWGFEGIVISDWGGGNDRVKGLIAGNHLEMPATGGDSDRQIVKAVKEGKIQEEFLNKRVEEYLKVLFDCQIEDDKRKPVNWENHHRIAKKAAAESAVLLKNEENILPLRKGTKVALIGDFAEIPRYQGAGSSLVNPRVLKNTLEEIKNYDVMLTGYGKGFNRNSGENEELTATACMLAKNTEVVLLYLGLEESKEAEGMDRSNMLLSENQVELLKKISKVNNNIIVVLSGGSAIEMGWLPYCKALLFASLPGQAGAEAMLEILTGEVNPSGKLAETYPIKAEDTPCAAYYPGRERTSEYREGIFAGYRYYDTAKVEVRFPFGYGLSYTAFSYSNLKINGETVEFTIENTGETAGAEIAQLYVRKCSSALFRADKELKGFAKIYLEQGEARVVSMQLNEMTYRYFNTDTNKFEIEEGEYEILIGASLTDIRLTEKVRVQGTSAVIKNCQDKLPSYYHAAIKNIPDQEFEELLGHAIPEANWDESKPLLINDTVAQLYYSKSLLARGIYHILTWLVGRTLKKRKPDLNIMYIYYMPFRNLAKMTGGAVTMKMAEALLEIINGHFGRGILGFFKAWRKKTV